MKMTHMTSISLRALSLLGAMTLISACGGGPGGGGSAPEAYQPRARPAAKPEDPYAPPPKPKIKKEAKQVFLEAGALTAQGPSRYEDAISLYERVYREEPLLKISLYNIALLYEQMGNQSKAIEAYKFAADNGVAEGWVGIGLMQIAAGNEGEAESSFRRALDMEPLNGRAHLNLARIAKNRGDQRQAMESIRSALKEDSRNADAYNLLAQIYLDLKRYKLALLVCNAGLEELDSEHSGLWTTQGIIFLNLKDVINATRSFREAIKFDDKNYAARLNLGLITFNYRDYERSYQLLSEAATLNPNNPEVVLSKAVAARALDRIDEAKQGYQKTLELKPNHPGALFNLAIIQQDYTKVEGFDARIQNVREAITQFENVLNFTQDDRLRKKVQRRIEEARLVIESIEIEKESAAVQQAQPAPAAQDQQPAQPQ